MPNELENSPAGNERFVGISAANQRQLWRRIKIDKKITVMIGISLAVILLGLGLLIFARRNQTTNLSKAGSVQREPITPVAALAASTIPSQKLDSQIGTIVTANAQLITVTIKGASAQMKVSDQTKVSEKNDKPPFAKNEQSYSPSLLQAGQPVEIVTGKNNARDTVALLVYKLTKEQYAKQNVR